MAMSLKYMSMLANDLGVFVRDNPDFTDTVEAYNKWVAQNMEENKFQMDEEQVLFALNQLDIYLHKLPRETLLSVLEDELRRQRCF